MTLTADALAERTGSDARYAREWLEQQAVSGILEVGGEHRFSLPAAFDAAIIIEALHDMANPVPVLRSVGASLVEHRVARIR